MEKFVSDYQKENNDIIVKAIEGLELSASELKTMEWIATWERSTVENVASVISKAIRKASAKKEKGVSCTLKKIDEENRCIVLGASFSGGEELMNLCMSELIKNYVSNKLDGYEKLEGIVLYEHKKI